MRGYFERFGQMIRTGYDAGSKQFVEYIVQQPTAQAAAEPEVKLTTPCAAPQRTTRDKLRPAPAHQQQVENFSLNV